MANKREAIYSFDERDRLLTPLVGTFRTTHLTQRQTNPLLIKPTLGTGKASTWDLPSRGNLQHEFGLRQIRDGSSSNQVLGEWHTYAPDENLHRGTDFKAINKHAVTQGVINCRGLQAYREENDHFLKLGNEKKKPVLPYDPITTAFGRPGIKQDNFNDLFNHAYRYDWVSEAETTVNAIAAKKNKKPGETKSSLALKASAAAKKKGAEPLPELWKMKLFKDVPSKVGPRG